VDSVPARAVTAPHISSTMASPRVMAPSSPIISCPGHNRGMVVLPATPPGHAEVTLRSAMPGKVHVITHPLVQHKLTLMRSKETSTSTFRNLLREISMLMAYEVCRDMPTTKVAIETPIAKMQAPMIDGKKIVLISILRAGNGILDGMLE